MAKRVVNRVSELVAIKSRELNRRITANEISQKTGIPEKTIWLWLNNKVNRFDGEKLVAFAEFLEVSVSDLLTTIEETEDDTLGNIIAALTA